MRVFLNELQKRHRASLRALFERHKAGVGYVILLLGTIVALVLAGQALRHADERAERQSAVICRNTVTADKQSLSNLYTKSGHELIKAFHLTIPQARVLIHKQLEASAQERKELQPSNPANACTSAITTLTATEVKQQTKQTQALTPTPHSKSTTLPVPLASSTTPARSTSPAPTTHHHVAPSHPAPGPNLHSSPVAPPTPPKAGGGTVPPVPPVITERPALEPPIPPTVTPPTIKVPPITVGPVTTPEVKVTVTVPKV